MTDSEVAGIFHWIRTKTSTEILDISFNKITNIGLSILLESLLKIKVKRLNLSNNKINGNGLDTIYEFCKKHKDIKCIDICNNSISFDDDVIVEKLKKIRDYIEFI